MKTGYLSAANLITPVAAHTWTSFILPISLYTDADSGNIMLSSFNASSLNSRPYGNSVLYVDNLSFDQLITSTGPDHPGNEPFMVYPDPAQDKLVVESFPGSNLSRVAITDLDGHEIVSRENCKSKTVIDISSMFRGVYFMKIIKDGTITTKKFIKD